MAEIPYTGATAVDQSILNGARPSLHSFVAPSVSRGVPVPIGNGVPHPLSAYYASVAAAQADYSFIPPGADLSTYDLAWAALVAGGLATAAVGSQLLLPAGDFRVMRPYAPGDGLNLFATPGAKITNVSTHGGVIDINGVSDVVISGGLTIVAANGAPGPPTPATATSEGLPLLLRGGCRNIRLRDLDISGHEFGGLMINGATDVLAERLHFHDGTDTSAFPVDAPHNVLCSEVVIYGAAENITLLDCTGTSRNDVGVGLSPIFDDPVTGYPAIIRNVQIIGGAFSRKNIYGIFGYGNFHGKGTWGSAPTYAPGDIVFYAGVIYRALLTNVNQAPPNASYWGVVPNTQRVVGTRIQGCEIHDVSCRQTLTGGDNFGMGTYWVNTESTTLRGNHLYDCLKLRSTGVALPRGVISCNESIDFVATENRIEHVSRTDLLTYAIAIVGNKGGQGYPDISLQNAAILRDNICDGGGVDIEDSPNTQLLGGAILNAATGTTGPAIFLSASPHSVITPRIFRPSGQGIYDSDGNSPHLKIGGSVEYAGGLGVVLQSDYFAIGGLTVKNGLSSALTLTGSGPKKGGIIAGVKIFDDQITPTQTVGIIEDQFPDLQIINTRVEGHAVNDYEMSPVHDGSIQRWMAQGQINRVLGQSYFGVPANYMEPEIGNALGSKTTFIPADVLNSWANRGTFQVSFPADDTVLLSTNYVLGRGRVTTIGTAVTLVDGVSFDAAMVGSPININSVSYTVAAYTDASHLTLTGSAGTQAFPVAYYAGTPVHKKIELGESAGGTIYLTCDPATGIVTLTRAAVTGDFTVDTLDVATSLTVGGTAVVSLPNVVNTLQLRADQDLADIIHPTTARANLSVYSIADVNALLATRDAAITALNSALAGKADSGAAFTAAGATNLTTGATSVSGTLP